MTQHPRFPSNRFWTALKSTATPQRATVFVSISLLLSLAIASTVLADYQPLQPTKPVGGSIGTLSRYHPPRSSRPSGRTVGTVVRGEGSCTAGTKGTLTALAPLGHTGQTTATHPTFAWYVPDDKPYAIEFTLYRYASNGKPISLYQTQLESQKGIMHHSLPPGETGLKVGETYLWQVALLCNPSSPDKDQVLRTDVEVVATPDPLQASLAKTADHSQRAGLYAEAGFWYDAFAEALADTKTRSFTVSLLEDLVKVEAAETSEKGKQQHDRLQQVLNAERK